MGKIVGNPERRTSLFSLICCVTVTCVIGEHKAVELGKDLFAHVCLTAITLGRLSQSKREGNSHHSSAGGSLVQILLSELLQQKIKNDAMRGLQQSFYVCLQVQDGRGIDDMATLLSLSLKLISELLRGLE